MEPGNVLFMYRQTSAALRHFDEQQKSASSHSALFHTSNAAQEQRQALSQIESFLRKSLRQQTLGSHDNLCEDIAPCKGLNDKLLSLAYSDRERETKIVAGITSTLEQVQIRLLADMTESEMLLCIREMEEDAIGRSERILKENMERAKARLDELVIVHSEKSAKTKDDIEQLVVNAECEKNKKLNKFEHSTRQFIRKTQNLKIELDWVAHQKDSSNTEHAIHEMTKKIERLKARIHLLKTASKKKEQRDDDSTHGQHMMDTQGTCTLTQSTEAVDDRNLDAYPPLSAIVRADEINPCIQNPTLKPPPATVSQSEDFKLETKSSQQSVIISDTASATDTATEPPNTVQARQPAGPENATTAPNSITEREPLLENENAANAKPPADHTRHNTPTSLRIKAKEYDHNKENVSSPLSASSKKSLTFAFDGLDKYARGLFSNGSRSSGGTASK